MRMLDTGVKFDSTSRILGKFSSASIGAFVLGQMWGVISEDATRVWFIRPVSELSEAERAEIADYQIRVWQRFKEGLD